MIKLFPALLLTFFINKIQAQVIPVPPLSLQLNGSGYVSIPDNPALDLQTSATIEGWYNFCLADMILSKNWCNYQAGYVFRQNSDGTVAFSMREENVCTFPALTGTSSSVYPLNDWHHFAITITVNAGTTKAMVYMDHGSSAVIDITGNWIMNNNNQDLKLGVYTGLNGGLGSFSRGRIQEFRVYNGVIPHSNLCLAVPATTPLVRLEMQSGTGFVVANTGTLGSSLNGVYNGTANYISSIPNLNDLELTGSVESGCVNEDFTISSPDAALTYSWQSMTPESSGFDIISDESTNTISYNPTTPGTYEFKLNGTIGSCTSTESILIEIEDCSLSLNENGVLKNDLHLYPNPVNTSLTIYIEGTDGGQNIAITNFEGQVIQEMTLETNSVEADVSQLSQGMYFVRITDPVTGISGSTKFIKN